MRRAARFGMLAAALAVLAGAARAQPDTERELLNSERIEREFGSYGIEVLAQTQRLRVSNLFSGTGDERVTRTFAVVRYPEIANPELADEHETIVAGGSIGAVLTDSGWTVRKRHRFFGRLDSGARIERLMGDIEPQPLATHVYVLEAVKPGIALEYATIAEVHHPGYLTLDDLRSIYGDRYEPPIGPDGLKSLIETLEIVEARMQPER